MDKFAYLMWRVLKKLNQDWDTNRMLVREAGFMTK